MRLFALALLAGIVGSLPENMMGAYRISPTPGAKDQNASPSWAQGYANYPNGTNYFDVVSPKFSTLYSQVGFP